MALKNICFGVAFSDKSRPEAQLPAVDQLDIDAKSITSLRYEQVTCLLIPENPAAIEIVELRLLPRKLCGHA